MKWFELVIVSLMVLALGSNSVLASGERVVVFVKAKPGMEKALFETTKQLMVEVRSAPGLERSDINVQNDDPSMMVLYYHWRSKEHGEAYRKSDLFKRSVTALEPYVAERRLIMLTNLD